MKLKFCGEGGGGYFEWKVRFSSKKMDQRQIDVKNDNFRDF